MFLAPILGSLYKPIIYYSIKLMVDIITKSKTLTYANLITPLIIYIVADVFFSFCWRITSVISYKVEPMVEKRIILRAFKRIFRLNFMFIQNTLSGLLISKIKGLLEGYNELWSQLWFGISFSVISSIAVGMSIFLVNYLLGIVIIIWSIIFILINYHFTKSINNLSQVYNDIKHSTIGKLSDSINNFLLVKLFVNLDYEEKFLSSYIDKEFVVNETKLLKFRLFVDILNDILSLLMIVIITLLMVSLRIKNLVSVGDFVFIFSTLFLLQENLWNLVQELHSLSDTFGTIKSSYSIFKEPYQNINHDKIELTSFNIDFNNIKFKYPNGNIIFEGLNLSIKNGEHIGLVGSTGSGKSTLINLILKLYTLDDGEIKINGININNIDSNYLRSKISVVTQDTNLFNRTILDNIRYGKLNASESEVIEACKKTYAHDFIMNLPLKYNTIVGERGVNLSAGQKQRIAMARAILKNSPILILDEATSNLDNMTERNLQYSLTDFITQKTVIFIAHRLTTIYKMDKIIVLNNGTIVQTGTHDELISIDGLYKNTWNT